jgi:hypothetical protein
MVDQLQATAIEGTGATRSLVRFDLVERGEGGCEGTGRIRWEWVTVLIGGKPKLYSTRCPY